MNIAAKCAEICAELTVTDVIARNAREHGERPALTLGEQTLSWAQLRDEVAALARGLADLGLAKGDRLMIMMSSRPEHWVADLAAVHVGAIPCTAYATLSGEQVCYVAEHSAATAVVLEGEAELARWREVIPALPNLRHVIVVDPDAAVDGAPFVRWHSVRARGGALHAGDPEVFEAMTAAAAPDDPIAMMYTSGTTGDPKGVVLTHRNVMYQNVALDLLVETPMFARSIAYLPLAHVAERNLGIYRAALKALHVTICPDPAQIVPTLGAVRPPSFFGVPRVWEKMAAGLQARLTALPDAQASAIAEARDLRLQAFRVRSEGHEVPAQLAEDAAAADAQVLAPLRAMLGLDRLEWASSGAAPIPVAVLELLASLGIEIYEVWGLSETTGCATVSTKHAFRLGAVGQAMPGVELRLADDGEIFVRGPIVLRGYLQADGTIESATDADGWFATGDVGTIDADGFLTITDRKKELIITSSGKNIAPSKIEGLLRAHPLVGQAIAIGDRRPYVTALIALDDEVAPMWATANGIAADGSLADHPAVRVELDALVASVNERLARVEQVKTYAVTPVAWTPESGEVTPTLKLKRRVIHDRYAEAIEALYA